VNWIKVNDQDSETLPPMDHVVHVIYLSDYDDGQVIALGGRVDDSEGWLWALNDNINGFGRDDKQNDLTADDEYRVTHWAEIKWP
jgi:hypothetical protein